MIRQFILTVFVLTLSISCADPVEPKVKKERQPTSTESKQKTKGPSLIEYAKEKKPEVKPKNPINNDNVRERLLSYGKDNPETIVDIYTSMGKVRARLYKDTPLHRANFIMMSKKGFLNGSVFTRVAPFFIAQSGGTFDEDHAAIKKSIGNYTLPSEMKASRFHKAGTLAAARRYKNNPNKRSDPYAFYFVEGTVYNEPTLKSYEKENNYRYNAEQRAYYLNNPGAAHLDGQHTVFGELLSGSSVIKKITQVDTDSRDWPIKDIFIDSVKVIR